MADKDKDKKLYHYTGARASHPVHGDLGPQTEVYLTDEEASAWGDRMKEGHAPAPKVEKVEKVAVAEALPKAPKQDKPLS